MDTLAHLERLLSITERFTEHMTPKDRDQWVETSAHCADEVLRRDGGDPDKV
jgi:hypothetical protein